MKFVLKPYDETFEIANPSHSLGEALCKWKTEIHQSQSWVKRKRKLEGVIRLHDIYALLFNET